MRRLTFKEYCTNRLLNESNAPILAKALELNKHDMQIYVEITLTRHEQHADAVEFLRRVADEIELLSSLNCNRLIKTHLD
jgi:hypothetical protein